MLNNKLDRILQQAHKFRGWLGQAEAALYNDYLSQYRSECLEKLTKESDLVRIHRLQGSLAVLDDMLQLRGTVDLYIKGVNTGQMRKIESKSELESKIEKENQHAVGQQRS